ncbi:hypothetical protein M3Y99_00532600 [Aphelenchoides fujianensis]|nr:hypothetical protein M3Y99_00532600 [Aphelenchoides fujianensis]
MAERPPIVHHRLLHRFSDDPGAVCIRLDVGGEHARYAMLGDRETITFVRLNVAEATLEVDHTTELPTLHPRSFSWSDDGREMYVMETDRPKELLVYSFEQKEWTTEPLPEGGPDVEVIPLQACPSTHTFYGRVFVPDNVITIFDFRLLRFDREDHLIDSEG